MVFGEQLIRWTIRLSMLCYAVFLISKLTGKTNVGRTFWIAGAGLMLAHVCCAFQFYHHWSNASAVAATATETRELLGFEFGAGVYFSYLFTVIWAADAGWWWLCPQAYECRAKWLTIAVHSYLFFIALNGTIVFEAGAMRWAGIALCILVAGSIARSLVVGRQPTTTTGQQA